jgi:hypothetical protein
MKRALAAILLLALSGCATVRYNYQGNQCIILKRDGDKVFLVCPSPDGDGVQVQAGLFR